MQTQFTSEQLADPAVREANTILRKCVHCGFCLATCPTYKLSGDELDSPRGRIYLIKDMLEKKSNPALETVIHIDRCLSCLSCMTACPSGVNYMHLIDYARAYIEKTHRRPLVTQVKRFLFAYFLPRPGIMRRMLRLFESTRLLSLLLPERLRKLAQLSLSPALKPGKSGLVKKYAADGSVKGNLALLPGCVQQATDNGINTATIRVLNRFGFNVHVLLDTHCCGAIEHHLGKTGQSHARMAQNIKNWAIDIDQLNLQGIIVNASGCGTLLKDYGYLFREDEELAASAKKISELTFDVTEFLTRIELDPFSFRSGLNMKVAYQNPCSMQHGQKIGQQPVNLLKKFGFQMVEIHEDHLCCGSAGTYNLLQMDIASELGQRKAKNIELTKPDIVASGNLGCMVQLGRYLKDIPVVHTVQLLDWASGGRAPSSLSLRSS